LSSLRVVSIVALAEASAGPLTVTSSQIRKSTAPDEANFTFRRHSSATGAVTSPDPCSATSSPGPPCSRGTHANVAPRVPATAPPPSASCFLPFTASDSMRRENASATGVGESSSSSHPYSCTRSGSSSSAPSSFATGRPLFSQKANSSAAGSSVVRASSAPSSSVSSAPSARSISSGLRATTSANWARKNQNG
jgi:hypothetical protein